MQSKKKERETSRRKKEIKEIRSFLDTLKLPEGLTSNIPGNSFFKVENCGNKSRKTDINRW